MTQFDAVVLGAGPGGYVAAIRCAQLGMKTAIVEKNLWGGVGHNQGGIPVMSLLRSADVAHLLTHDKEFYGITGETSCDYTVAHARSRAVAERMSKGVHFLMKKNKITEYQGWGTFKGPSSLSVAFDTGVVETLTFDHCVIAAGATAKPLPMVLPGPHVWTYQDLVVTPSLPESVVIVGAGSIGVEFAYILAGYGVRVTLVESAKRLLPDEEPEASALLLLSFSFSLCGPAVTCGVVFASAGVTALPEQVGWVPTSPCFL